MKALAIDCAVSKITIAAKDDNSTVKLTYDIGIKQSEKLLPAIDFVMKELGILVSDLNYTTLTLGPGTFTGLRLGLSALKAITLCNNTPIYATGSLEAYAYPYSNISNTVISVIEAKEDEYFFQLFMKGKAITEPEDKTIEEILSNLDAEAEYFVAGPAAAYFCERAKDFSPLMKLVCLKRENDTTESLFSLSEEKIAANAKPLLDYDGPLYVRKSEAELVLEKKQTSK